MPAPAVRDKLRTRALAKTRKPRVPNARAVTAAAAMAVSSDANATQPAARYEQVKRYIRNTIESGERRAGTAFHQNWIWSRRSAYRG